MKYITGDVYFKKEKVDIYPYLSFNAETDICIIGGGISGLVTGYFLSEKEKSIMIIEKNLIGRGISLGEVGECSINYDDILMKRKTDEIKKIFELYSDAKKDLIKLLNDIECKYSLYDKYVYTTKLMQKQNFKKNITVLNDVFNMENKLIDNEESLKQSIYIKCDDKVVVFNSNEFTNNLAKFLFEKRNVNIYENTEIVDFVPNYNEVNLKTNNDYEITAGKVIFCTGIDIIDMLNLNIPMYERFVIVTDRKKELEGRKKHLTCFNEDEKMLTLDDGRIVIFGEETKINMRMVDESYRKNLSKDKNARLIVKLNKIFNLKQYADKGRCYSYIIARTFDNFPYIDEIECMPNCFINASFGNNSFLNSIVGSKILTHAIDGLFVKEIRFFRLNRINCK